MLMVGVRGPIPAVLNELTVRKYCVYPFRPLMFTVYWLADTRTFPMVSGLVSSSQYMTCVDTAEQTAQIDKHFWHTKSYEKFENLQSMHSPKALTVHFIALIRINSQWYHLRWLFVLKTLRIKPALNTRNFNFTCNFHVLFNMGVNDFYLSVLERHTS